MLNIKVRGIRGTAKYLEVKIEYGGTEIDLGLLDAGERRELATILETAQDELLEGLNATEEQLLAFARGVINIHGKE